MDRCLHLLLVRLTTCGIAVLTGLSVAASTLTWKGPSSGGNWTSTANWRSSDGRYLWNATNSYDFSSLQNGAVIVNDATGVVRIAALTLPRTSNATWTFKGTANVRLTTELMPLKVPSGSTLNLELGASNPWNGLAENGYRLSGGGTVRHTKKWEQWHHPNIILDSGTVVIAGDAGGGTGAGFGYTHFNLTGDTATLRLETSAVVADVTCPAGVAATIDLNGYTLRRDLKDSATADWTGRLVGGGRFVAEGGIPIALTRTPEAPVAFEVRNAVLGFGTPDAPVRLPAGSSVDITSGGTLKLHDDQTLARLEGSSPIGAVDIPDGRTLTVDAADDSTCAARLTGGGGLTKAGTGSLTLSGRSTYAGPTRVADGTLAIAGAVGGFANLWTFDSTATNEAAGGLPLAPQTEWSSYRFLLPVRAPNGRTGGCLHFPHDPAANVHYRILTADATVVCGTNAFTVGAWIRPVFTNVEKAVLFCGAYPSADSNRRLFQVNVAAHSVSHSATTWAQQRIELPCGALDDGAWHHVCVTETATERRTYVDGVLLDVAAGTYDIDSGPLSIGGKDLWTSDYEGDLDDVFVIARALDAAEVRRLVNESSVADGARPSLPRPVAHWSFDDDFTDDVNGIALVSGVGRVASARGEPVLEAAPGAIGKCVSFAADKSCLTLPPGAPYPECLPTGHVPFTVSIRLHLKRQSEMLAHVAFGDLAATNRGFWAGGYSYPASLACGTASSGWNYLYSFTDSTFAGAVAAPGTSASGWGHLVIVYDGAKLRHYRDGRLIKTSSNALIDLRPQDLYLGHLKPANRYSGGSVDDLGIYDVALTADEVRRLTEDLATGASSAGALPPSTDITVDADATLQVSGTDHAVRSLTGSGRLSLAPGSSLAVESPVAFAGSLSGSGTLVAPAFALTGDASEFHGTLVVHPSEAPPADLTRWTLPTPPAGESWRFDWTNGTLRLYTAQPALPPDPVAHDESDVAYVWGTKGGGLSSLGLGNLDLTPRLVKANWKSDAGVADAYAIEPDGSRRFTIATDEGAPLAGRLVLTQKDERTVRATWTFTPTCDTAYYQLLLQTFLSVPAYAGGRVLLGPDARPLPLTASASANVASVALENASGETIFNVAFPDAKRLVQLTEPSSWDVETATFTICRANAWPLSTLKRGEDYVLTVDLSATRPVKLVKSPLTCVETGSDWIPLDPVRFPKPGSALDFTDQRGTTGPAGAHGRVIRVDDHFAFASDPSGHPRFYGNNIDIGDGFPAGEDAARFARNLAAFGYNALRVWLQDGVAWRDTGDPALVALNPTGVDKVDWFLAKCFENGIYVTLDLSCDRTNTWRSVGVDRDGNVPSAALSYLAGLHDGIRANYLSWVKSFFTHRNPYTGRTYAEEPALVGFNLLNESNNSLVRAPTAYPADLRDLAKTAWRAYAARKKAEDPTTYGNLTDSLPTSFTELPNGPAYMQMVAEGERRLAADAHRVFREEIGSPIPLANLNGGSFNIPLLAAKDAYDYDDDHRYVDHPSFLEESWRLPARAGNGNGNFITAAFIGNVYSSRLIDRPYTISEDNLCAPWCNAAASGLAIGAISALQGHSAAYRFNWADNANYTTPERQAPDSFFTVAANPLMAASERLAVALFSRGDLVALDKRYVYTIDPSLAGRPAADNADAPGAYFPLGWAAWRARVGLAVTNEAPAGTIPAGAWPTIMRKTRPDSCAELGIASPSGVETLADGSTVEVDQLGGSLAVSTARTAAGYAEAGTISAGPLVADIGKSPATVWASALDGRPLGESCRLLFGHLTEAQAEGRRFSDPSKNVLLSWGAPPHLMRAGRADIALALGRGRYCVHALASDGTRRFEVPCRAEGDVLRFTADVAAEPTRATCLYEIVRQPGLSVILR